jgi:hypothetical protein
MIPNYLVILNLPLYSILGIVAVLLNIDMGAIVSMYLDYGVVESVTMLVAVVALILFVRE